MTGKLGRPAWRTGALLAVLAATMGVAACGSSSSGSGGSSGGGGTSSSSSGPIKIMAFTVNIPALQLPEIVPSLTAAADAVNAAGGINGRKLQVIGCNTRFDPNATLECARKAVSDHVVAAVGGVAYFQTIFPTLEKAGIAWLGGFGTLAQELQSPVSFPVGGGDPGWIYGQAKLLADKGVKHPAFVACQPAACQFEFPIFKSAWAKYGTGPIKTVTVPDNQTDLSSIAASLISGGIDGVATGEYASENAQLIKELRQQGFTGPIVVNAPNLNASIVKGLGKSGTANLFTIGNELPPSTQNAAASPAVKNYLAQMHQYAPSTLLDELSTNAWAAGQVFIQAAKRIKGDVNADSFLSELKGTTSANPIDVGMAPPFTAPPSTPPLKEFPRIGNLQVAVAQAQPNGQFTQSPAASFIQLFGS